MKALVILLFVLSACVQPRDATVEVLVGGTLLDGQGGPPVQFPVVVIRNGRIEAVGLQTHLPIPRGSRKTDTAGYSIRPPAGGRIQPGGPANLELVDEAGNVRRRMRNGAWE